MVAPPYPPIFFSIRSNLIGSQVKEKKHFLYKLSKIVLSVPMVLGNRTDFDCTEGAASSLFLLRYKRFCLKQKRLSKTFRAQQHFCSRGRHFEIFVNLLPYSGKLEPSPLIHSFAILMVLSTYISKMQKWCKLLWVRDCNFGSSHHTYGITRLFLVKHNAKMLLRRRNLLQKFRTFSVFLPSNTSSRTSFLKRYSGPRWGPS